MQHFWVVGTDTDVGKTFITTLFMRQLQMQGHKVIPYKPVQTGEVENKDRSYYHDTASYLKFSLQPLAKEALNTYSFPTAASPHYAAELEGEVVREDKLLKVIDQFKKTMTQLFVRGQGDFMYPFNRILL